MDTTLIRAVECLKSVLRMVDGPMKICYAVSPILITDHVPTMNIAFQIHLGANQWNKGYSFSHILWLVSGMLGYVQHI